MNRTMHEIEPEEVMAYLDGELQASRASEVAAHIAACAECASIEADLHAVSSQLIQWQVEAAPLSIAKSIEQSMAQPGTAARVAARQRRGLIGAWHRLVASQWAWKLGFASIALLLVGTIYIQQSPTRSMRAFQTFSGLRSAAPSAPPSANTEMSANVQAIQELQAQKEQLSESLEKDAAPDVASPAGSRSPAPTPGPMIARTASMNLVITTLDAARASLEKLLARHHAFASDMTLDQSNDASASLNATLQVPSAELDATLSDLRALGRVSTESQGGEDVSDQHVDLAARLHNARESEERLLDILRTRTGKVSDVLAVEEQISQTRGEIEQMEAQLANLDKRVSYASIKLEMAEEYKAPTGANSSVALRLRNAVVSGYRDAVDSLLALAVFLLSAGPTLLLWAGLLFFPARAIWKRRGSLRAAFSKNAA
jgi:anti-sigma factor RsiW